MSEMSWLGKLSSRKALEAEPNNQLAKAIYQRIRTKKQKSQWEDETKQKCFNPQTGH
jgi:hypothetical protein